MSIVFHLKKSDSCLRNDESFFMFYLLIDSVNNKTMPGSSALSSETRDQIARVVTFRRRLRYSHSRIMGKSVTRCLVYFIDRGCYS